MRHWKKFLWAGLCALSLLGFWLMYRSDGDTISELTHQMAAENWETEEKPYAMASVFLEPEQGISQSRMGEIYLAVENALTAGGVPSEEYPWFYAASYLTDATLKNGTSTCDVELTAVAGDFFRIHPMELVSGWYMNEDDVMHDRIILDRQTAWNLFYSSNVAGQFVEVNGVQYQVAAVVDTESGKYNEMAAEGTCRAWVYADSPALSATEGANTGTGTEEPMAMVAETDLEQGFTCMEIVLPEPVKEFTASTLKTALKDMIPENTLVTDNTRRFSLKSRWDILRNLSTRGISSDAIPYPYWENAARLTENHLALRLIPEGFLVGFPAISLLILLLWLNHRRTWGFHSLRTLAENAVDRKRQRDYEARQRGEEPERVRRRKQRQEGRRSRRQRQKALQYASKNRRWRK